MTNLFVFQKHSDTAHWVAYLKSVEAFNAATNFNLRTTFAEAAIKQYNVLTKSSFFDAYTSLQVEWLDLHPLIANHLNQLPNWIKDAAIEYFMDKFGIPESCITCKDAITGTRSAIHCKVNVGEIVYEYRIKTNHGAGTSTRGNFTSKCYSLYYFSLIHFILDSHFKLNLIELYIYKLLEAIGTGPKVLFIANSVGANRIVYIASEYMTSFRTFKDYSDGMPKSGNAHPKHFQF